MSRRNPLSPSRRSPNGCGRLRQPRCAVVAAPVDDHDLDLVAGVLASCGGDGLQDGAPAQVMWAAQVHVWQATLDRHAYVFTSYPGGFEDDYMAGPWTGGFLPRATLYQNVGVIQYRRVEQLPRLS